MKTLYRSRKHKIISGVAGGIGDYFEIDPVFIRVLFIITIFTGGVGLLAYIVLWIIVPNEPFEYASKNQNQSNTGETEPGERDENWNQTDNTILDPLERTENKNKIRIFGGLLLILLGLIILLDNIVPGFDFTYVWSIILILIGSYIIFSSPRRRRTNE